MATRKIRLTLSGTQADGQGPIVDVDFNGVNQETDLDVSAVYGSATIVKEYTVDVDAGTYNLDIDYKNDEELRDLTINSIEYANDGINYQDFSINETNSNLSYSVNFTDALYQKRENPDYDPADPASNELLLNPSYDSALVRTDTGDISEPGSNPKYLYDTLVESKPPTIYTSGVTTFNITFS